MPEPVEGQERDHNEDVDVDVDEGTSTVGSIDQCLSNSLGCTIECHCCCYVSDEWLCEPGCVIVTNDNNKLW